MRTSLLILTLAIQGCIVMGRSQSGAVPDLGRIEMKPGETTLHEILTEIGTPDEWHGTGQGMLLLWRVRVHRFGRYGINFAFFGNVVPGNLAVSAVLDNVRFTYDRAQQAEFRLGVLVDRHGKLLSFSSRDGRDRMTFF
ncbi:MAG: hypothetical protein O7H41_17885 [Planctomycetota bacterium]|nr:hypothetical protein [Planctomycetota bacterium]